MGVIGDKYFQNPKSHKDLGIMRAMVVNNNDKDKVGKVRIRIPSFHGVPGLTDRFIEDEGLPWAMPCFYGGCGQDFGSFIVPIPGTFVWVMFEDGDVDKPVYLGGVPSVGSNLEKTVNNLDDPESPQQPWQTQPGMADAPWDVFHGKATGVPERSVIYKSQKGHTIMCDDTDADESMTIIDRLGQVLKFFCPVEKDKNAEKYHRELNSAENDKQLGDGLVDDPWVMLRSGIDKDGEKKIHSMIKMFKSRMRGETIDSDKKQETTTDYYPGHMTQTTQDPSDISQLHMALDRMYMKYGKDYILEYFCSSYYRTTAFKKCFMEFTPDHMKFLYDGNGITIDKDHLEIKFKGTVLTETESTFTVKTKDSWSVSANNASISGNDQSLSGKGKEINFQGSGKVYTQGGKTYMQGSEIHFNK